ncbi:MAG: hypothetical protein D4R64_06180 [Porphyromonadaceae bacterium]|nr:MAG: hypothetical protein D4R64_06180 [Porphyromonadaceae bacterium]
MTWKDYFTLIKVQPGRIVTPRFGTLDFSDPNLPVEKVQALFEDDFPYLQITSLGLETLYPVPPLAKLPFKKVEPLAPARRTVKRKA